ncbi:ubiquitin-conjugating enzyme/RWD-like protein [Glomus cerebriforme]|uniref:E2 ubiquitin-conjugating enzyme n=1 Tax=Glomus cerebriforme TaxID=658196 RepID=A0A397TAD7_9GLOM|nr:ubiquitin-conjugating enzyme/RWD-like protein [Glomus cerebriforme]
MSAIENISPSVIKRISKELNSLVVQPLEGIRVIVNELDVCDVQAWILGPESTPYEGGYFKVKLVLGADFPAAPPKCYFITKIFHPNVSKSGEVCVNTLKKDWNKDSGVERILLTVKCLLIVPNPESALNEEAGKLLLENYDDYAKHARMMTKIHAQNKSAEFSSNNTNSSSASATTITSTSPSSTSSPKKFVSSQIMMKSTTPQSTSPSTTATITTTNNNSNTTNSINNSSTVNIPALITPLTVSNSMNESKSSNAMNNGGINNNLNHLKKSPNSSMNSSDNQLLSNNPTVTPKKRAGDKKLDKKQTDKKRSLKRL